MLDKDLYDSWKSQMELYLQNREHGRMILESVENGLLIWPTIEENGVFRDDPIACLNKAMAFLTAIASSRVIVAQLQRTMSKLFGEGHMARQCTQPKRPRNATWYKEKEMLAEDQEAGQILDEEQLVFLADPGVQDVQVPHSATYLNDMENQSVDAMPDFEQTPAMDFSDNEIHKFFEKNDLKAQLQDKDSTICKLKDMIKSMREKSKDEDVKYDYCDIETKNVELGNSVAKLSSKNELLCNETNHVKQVFKEQFESIKKTRFRSKEQSDSFIDKLNLKSVENEDLKAQIQDKEQADILWGIVEQAKEKQPLDKELDFACIVRFGERPYCKNYSGMVTIQLGNVTISRVYYVEGLGHNLFSIGQFCDRDLEVAFQKNTCFIRNLKGVDLLSGSRDTNLYFIISWRDDKLKSSSICLISKAVKTKR
ncbi:hypothetical protein Tco_0115754 [Tanacetum coccineum]